jgi:hypothetical protein
MLVWTVQLSPLRAHCINSSITSRLNNFLTCFYIILLHGCTIAALFLRTCFIFVWQIVRLAVRTRHFLRTVPDKRISLFIQVSIPWSLRDHRQLIISRQSPFCSFWNGAFVPGSCAFDIFNLVDMSASHWRFWQLWRAAFDLSHLHYMPPALGFHDVHRVQGISHSVWIELHMLRLVDVVAIQLVVWDVRYSVLFQLVWTRFINVVYV